MKTNRVNKVLSNMQAMGLEQILITDPVSVFYLTGSLTDPGERFYALNIDKNGECRLFANNLFSIPEIEGLEVVYHSDAVSFMPQLEKYIDKTKALGVDKNLNAKFLIPMMESSFAESFKLASTCVDSARAAKDEEERELMRAASRINDAAMARFRGLIKAGITERELASQIEGIYKELGADGCSFEPIVGFGANTIDGHHVPDNTVLKEGDAVLLDVGCKKDMYCADMTRVFFYKREPDDEVKKIYALAKEATETAESVCAPGAVFADIDRAARSIIENAGYGHTFVHRAGHFIGLEVHDFGDVSALNHTQAVPGNIFSIEPSIFAAGKAKVYIEDLVLITEDGREILNKFSHDLDVVE